MIEFRKVTKKDFEILYFWLNLPHIKKFWDPDKEFSFDQIFSEYSTYLSDENLEMFIFSIDNTDIGFIQAYLIEDLSFYSLKGSAKGIDMYIGEKKVSLSRLRIENYC